jgi:uncharacterized protein YfiM (DUF2279 family)
MIRVAAAILVLSWPFSLDRWFGADKLKHFLMSALIQSTVYSTARAAGVAESPSRIAGGAAVMGAGILKERQDRRASKPFSIEDLAWDAAGGVAAGALLSRTRPREKTR